MIFIETPLPGAFSIGMERIEDDRGFFARAFCAAEFALHGLRFEAVQNSISYNSRRHTLRGMHFQAEPHQEDKVIRCTAGAIFDVIVDLREGSATCRRWWGTELSAANRRSLFVPRGFAHGFITLEDASEVFYMISVPFAPQSARGIRWNDVAIGVHWPVQPDIISPRDAGYPLLDQTGPA